MCDCKSCVETDSLSGFILDNDLQVTGCAWPAKGFANWPKGEHIRRSGKDKVYTAHWNHCGAEAHKKREKLDMRMHLGGKSIPLSAYKDLAHYAPFYTGARAWDAPIAWIDKS